MDYYGGGYVDFDEDYEGLTELRRDTVLVLADGTELPVTEVTQGYGGGSSHSDSLEKSRHNWDSQFTEVFDAGAVEFVRVGEIEIPLTGEE